jgi:hypothetical protein
MRSARALSLSPAPTNAFKWRLILAVSGAPQTSGSMRSGGQADSVASPPLAIDMFCLASDNEVTKPKAAPVVSALDRQSDGGVEDTVTRHSLRPALNVLAILRNKPAFHLKSARGVFAAAKALDITLPLSCIRRPTGD